jgi:hypothetical protein
LLSPASSTTAGSPKQRSSSSQLATTTDLTRAFGTIEILFAERSVVPAAGPGPALTAASLACGGVLRSS